MAGLFDSDIPPWMRDTKKPIDYFLEGQQVGNQIAANIMRGRALQMEAAQTTASIGNMMATTELKKQQLDELNRENQAWLKHDSQSIPKWMSATPEQRALMPTPEPQSRRGEEIVKGVTTQDRIKKYQDELTDIKKMQADVQLQRAQLDTERAQHLTERVASWDSAVSLLDDETYRQIQNLPNKGRLDNGMPTDEALRIVNLKRAAEGKPPIGTEIKGGKDLTLEPKTKTLSDGTTLAWMPGSSTMHVIKDGKKVELTPSQAVKLSESADSEDDREFFQEYAVAKGKSLTGGFTPKPKEKAKAKTEKPSLWERIGNWFSGGEETPAATEEKPTEPRTAPRTEPIPETQRKAAVERAYILSKEHPDWTKPEIIKAVNEEFGEPIGAK